MVEQKEAIGELMDKNNEFHTEESENMDQSLGTVRPPHWKMKFISLLVGMLALGYCSSLQGPTLPDFEDLFNTDTASLSGAITASSVGSILGSVICGLIFERINYELQFLRNVLAHRVMGNISGLEHSRMLKMALDVVLMGLCNLLPPFTGSLAGLIGACVLAGATRGFFSAAAQAYLLYLLDGHRFQDSSMQIMHAVWSLGATVGPLITQRFLSSRPGLTSSNFTNIMKTTGLNLTRDCIYHTARNTSLIPENVSKVGFAYVTLGSMTIVSSLPMWSLLLKGPRKIFINHRKSNSKKPKNEVIQTRFFKGVMLTLLFTWFLSYVAIESLPINFLATWALKSLHWPKYTGSLLTSTFCGLMGLGRIIGIFIAAFLSARQMLFICVTLTTISYVTLTAFYRIHATIVWVSLALAGLGISCSLATVILWTSSHITITGPVSAVFYAALSIGLIVIPIPTAYLFQEFSPDWLLYIILTAASLNLVILVLLEVFVRLYKSTTEQTEQLKSTE